MIKSKGNRVKDTEDMTIFSKKRKGFKSADAETVKKSKFKHPVKQVQETSRDSDLDSNDSDSSDISESPHEKAVAGSGFNDDGNSSSLSEESDYEINNPSIKNKKLKLKKHEKAMNMVHLKTKATSKDLKDISKSETDESSVDNASDDVDDDADDVVDDENNSEEDEDVEEEPEDEYAAIKKELSNVPLEDLIKIKEKLGTKTFNKIMHGGKFERKSSKRVFTRENKNRPMEVSSRRPVPIIRKQEVAKPKVRRDPRFDDLSGEYDEGHFERNYSFLNDIKSKEKLLIEKKIKKTTDETKKTELRQLLNRMNQQSQTQESRKKKQELEAAWKVKEKEMIKDGKTPYFLKNADKKKLELADKFKALQKSGKVDQYLSKKRKKNAQKERKKLPERHDR